MVPFHALVAHYVVRILVVRSPATLYVAVIMRGADYQLIFMRLRCFGARLAEKHYRPTGLTLWVVVLQAAVEMALGLAVIVRTLLNIPRSLFAEIAFINLFLAQFQILIEPCELQRSIVSDSRAKIEHSTKNMSVMSLADFLQKPFVFAY